MTLKIIERYDRPFEYGGVLMSLVLAFKYLSLWLSPEANQVSIIYSFATLMAFEFIMVHSGVFMAVMPKKVTLFLLLPLYGLFALAFNYSIPDGNSILYIYFFVVFNRMRFAFSDVPKHIRIRAVLMSVFSVLIYFVLVMIVAIFSDSIPEFGLNSNFLESSGYNDHKTSGGLFTDLPHTAICLGFTYYTLIGLIQLYLLHKNISFLKRPDSKSA